MSPERVILTGLAVIMTVSIATALMLADRATWPAALLAGLAAGGATLWGLLGWFGRARP
ncbi:hypothetical protein ACWEJ6_52280 [Nonomuraea sp. NPDC004702]